MKRLLISFHLIAIFWVVFWGLFPRDSSIKIDIQKSLVGRFFTDYTYLTGAFQPPWRIFAPDPPVMHRQIIVYSVKSMSPQNGEHPATPVFDQNPLFDSDEYLASFLYTTRAEIFLSPFSRHWAKVYEKKNGHLPLEINIVLNEGRIPPIFSSSEATTPSYSKQILWQEKL
jgi:hypothetical protein